MKKVGLVVVVIIATFAFWLVMKGPINYEPISDISEEEFDCARELAHVALDNPIEKIILDKVNISKDENGELLAKAYYPIGIPYAEIRISKNCNGARISR